MIGLGVLSSHYTHETGTVSREEGFPFRSLQDSGSTFQPLSRTWWNIGKPPFLVSYKVPKTVSTSTYYLVFL